MLQKHCEKSESANLCPFLIVKVFCFLLLAQKKVPAHVKIAAALEFSFCKLNLQHVEIILYLITNATYFIFCYIWVGKKTDFVKVWAIWYFYILTVQQHPPVSSHMPYMFMLAVCVAKPRASATHLFRALFCPFWRISWAHRGNCLNKRVQGGCKLGLRRYFDI